jgi:hypothetical protein
MDATNGSVLMGRVLGCDLMVKGMDFIILAENVRV